MDQQQQWMMMQQQPQQQYGGMQSQQPQYSNDEIRTLWIGDLQYWVDENYLHSCFAHTGEVVSIKIIRNKLTGHPEGYGFVEFVSHAAAERILHTYNGTQMPSTEQVFRMNWASFGIGERRPEAGPEHSIFVGDLAPDVTDYLLQETFRTRYTSVRGAKVVTDPNTGRSKGYGFVKFSDENERNRAMTEMSGVYCSTRPMRISAATPKKSSGFQQQYTAKVGWGQPQADPNQWNGAYYGYGQGYDAYGYAAPPQDPSMYAYGAYPGYGGYQQQTDVQEVATTSTVQTVEHKEEEVFDPLAPPDVDKLNAAYIAVHEPSLVGRHLWLKTSELSQTV